MEKWCVLSIRPGDLGQNLLIEELKLVCFTFLGYLLPGVTKVPCFLEALKYLTSKQHPFETPGIFCLFRIRVSGWVKTYLTDVDALCPVRCFVGPVDPRKTCGRSLSQPLRLSGV